MPGRSRMCPMNREGLNSGSARLIRPLLPARAIRESGLDLDFVLHADHSRKILDRVSGQFLRVLVLDRARQRDDAIGSLGFNRVVEDGVEIIGSLGGVFDLTVG